MDNTNAIADIEAMKKYIAMFEEAANQRTKA